MMEKMKEREETLKHMQNYGMGSEGKEQSLHMICIFHMICAQNIHSDHELFKHRC